MKSVFIEHNGALYRGVARAYPAEIWAAGAWYPYGGETPRDAGWGTVITEAEANALMGITTPENPAPEAAAPIPEVETAAEPERPPVAAPEVTEPNTPE